MTSPSKTKKAQAFHRVYTLITHLDPSAEIVRDRLYKRYEANRYGARVKFDQKRFRALKGEFTLLFCSEFGLSKVPDLSDCYTNSDVSLSLFVRERDMNYVGADEVLVDIILR